MQIIETVIQFLVNYIFQIVSGGSIIGISLFEFKYKIIRKKYAAYFNRKKSFADFSKDLETISRKLDNDGDTKKLWGELQTQFNQECFHRRIRTRHNSKRDEGEKLINDIVDFSEKEILMRDDRESLNAFAEEFQLLDRFDVESREKRKLLLTGLASAAVGGIGGIGGTHLVRPALRKVNWRYVSFTHKNKNHTNDPASNYQFILAGAMDKLRKL